MSSCSANVTDLTTQDEEDLTCRLTNLGLAAVHDVGAISTTIVEATIAAVPVTAATTEVETTQPVVIPSRSHQDASACSSSASSSSAAAASSTHLPVVVIDGAISGEICGPRRTTGLVYDERCLLHASDEADHLERPQRLGATIELLEANGLTQLCTRVPARLATYTELGIADGTTKRHIDKLDRMTNRLHAHDTDACEKFDGDTYVNRHTLTAARLSVGGLIDLVQHVMTGTLRNGFALLRPPGHHADDEGASGFCIFNNVAKAVQVLRKQRPELKIAIADFDVHDGNGTARCFQRDPNVLFFSIHRHVGENPIERPRVKYYPGTGFAHDCGKKQGKGSTIKVPLNQTDMGDHEYVQAFETILLPVLDEFKPDIILVSAGFDAAHNDPIGSEMHLTSAGFATLTSLLMKSVEATHGRVVMALEGGYNLTAVSEGVAACIRVLLGETPPPLPHPNWFIDADHVFEQTRIWRLREVTEKRAKFAQDLEHCRLIQQKYWACLSAPEHTATPAASAAPASAATATASAAE